MKKYLMLSGCLLLLAACSPSSPPAATPTPAASAAVSHAYAVGSKKKGDSAICAVCAVKEGTSSPETVAETIDYEGKTYTFCNESEKAEFISSPAKYAEK